MMKTVMKIMLLLCFALLLTGCGDKPASVAEKFSTALAKGDFTEAKKYATSNTGQLLDFLAGLGPEANKMAENNDFKFVLIKEEINGDKATVFFKDGVSGKEDTLAMVKVDGKWKADVPKT